jgi:Flp pilus assembly protein TadD
MANNSEKDKMSNGAYESEVRTGEALYSEGNFAKAGEAFERALQVQPAGLEATAGLAKVLLVTGAFADAKDLYTAAFEHGLPATAEHLTNFGLCYAFAGDRPKARELMVAALETDAGYEPAYGALARHCVIMADFEAAELCATEGLGRFPNNLPCLEARALARLSMLNLAGA